MTSGRISQALGCVVFVLIFLVFSSQLRRLPRDARVYRWIRWTNVLVVVYLVLAKMWC
ncbi:MAG: hypothetical protein U0610_21605 [bacterium]